MEVFIIIGLILLNGILSMSEIAMVSARKPRLEADAKRGSRAAKTALKLSGNPDVFLSTIQIGITLIGILTGIYSGDMLAQSFGKVLARIPALEAHSVAIAQVIIVVTVTYLTLILGELVPKRIGMSSSERVAKIVARPMSLLSKIALPFVWLLSKSTAGMLRILGINTVDGNRVTEEEIKAIIQEGAAEGEIEEVEQDIVRLKLGVFGSDAVEALGSQRVDLIEGEGAEADGHAAEGVLDAARAIEGHALLAEDDVGLFGVDIDEDGGNIAELFPEQSYQRITVGELRAGADEADHDLAAVCAPAQEDVPHEALAALFVIGLDAVGSEEGAESVADVVQDAGLQLAVGAGDDAVGAPGVKTDAGCAVLIAAHRELDFVAVAVYLRGGEGVQHRHIQPADAAEGVGDALLLGTQFGSIIQMPQAAAAAGAGYRAVHRDAVRRGGEQLVQNAEGVPAAVLDDAHLRLVAGGSARDKDGLALRRVGHAAAVVGKALDAQGEKLIFL